MKTASYPMNQIL